MKQVEQFVRGAEPMRMTAGEKAKIRSALSAFMEARPAMPGSPIASPYMYGWTSVFSMRSLRLHYVQALLVVVLATGGTVTAAAQNSLPGDPLYGVKLNFNEKMTTALALSDGAKASHEADLAERRLKEAASLSAQGRLTPEVRGQIQESLEAHVDSIEKQVKKLAANNNVRQAVEVNSELESALRVHEQVLLDLSDRSDEAAQVASTVRDELESVSRSLDRLEKKMPNEVSREAEGEARAKSDEAKVRLGEAEAMLEASRETARPEALAQAERHIGRSKSYLSQGDTKIENGSFSTAFIFFQRSLRYSKEAKLTIEASRDLKIDVMPPAPPKEGPATTTGEVATTTATTTGEAKGDSATTTGEVAEDGTSTTTATTTAEASADAGLSGTTSEMLKTEPREGARKLQQRGLRSLFNI